MFSSTGLEIRCFDNPLTICAHKVDFFQLPCNSGIPLDRVESDISTRQAIEMLVELSVDSLDMIAWALSELLDRLAKVSHCPI